MAAANRSHESNHDANAISSTSKTNNLAYRSCPAYGDRLRRLDVWKWLIAYFCSIALMA